MTFPAFDEGSGDEEHLLCKDVIGGDLGFGLAPFEHLNAHGAPPPPLPGPNCI